MNFRHLPICKFDNWNKWNFANLPKTTKITSSKRTLHNLYLLQSTVSQVQQHISPSAKSNSTFLFLAFPCPFLSYPFLRQLANYVYALKYCTNTVANINILYMNFIRCDVAHRKLNGVGSSVVEPQPKPARLWYANLSCTHPETTSKLREWESQGTLLVPSI